MLFYDALIIVWFKDVKKTFFILATFFYVFYFAQRFFILKKRALKHFWDYRNELIGHSDVVYLVSPNILNKTFLTHIFS